jgi:dCTP deaminase
MPFWSDESWRALPPDKVPVDPFDPDRLEEAKYIMAVGEEVYISSEEARGTITQLGENQAFQIAPGQFAYILTREVVHMPPDAIGFISINARVKFQGLVNISGFHVDPGYYGKLLFSVFNAGPSPIHLRRGQAIFPLWLASLDKPIKRPTSRAGWMSIDPNLITSISGNYTSVYQLSQVVRTLRAEFDATKGEVTSLQATRLHFGIVLAVVGFIFGGLVVPSLKYIVDWIRNPPPAEVRPASPQPLSPPAPTRQPAQPAQLPANRQD